MGSTRVLRRGTALLAAGAVAVALVPAADVAAEDRVGPSLVPGTEEAAARAAERPFVPPEERTRRASPEDRYALAGGCYTIHSLAAGGPVHRDGDGPAARPDGDAEPFHIQATNLGRYLLYGAEQDFLAVSDGLVGETGGTAMDNSIGAMVSGLTQERIDALLADVVAGPLGEATGRGDAVVLAADPSPLADWEIDEVPGVDGAYRIALPALARAHVAVTDDGGLTLVTAREAGPETHFAFQLTDGCADSGSWSGSGRP